MYLTVEEVKAANIKALEGLSDDFIESQIEHLSNIVDEYCNTKFKPTGALYITDYRSKIIVPKKPLLEVVDLTIAKELQLEDETYFVYPNKNLIVLDLDTPPKQRRKAVETNYIYGYEEVPAQVKEVILGLLKAKVFEGQRVTGIKSERWEDYQYDLFDNNSEWTILLSSLDRYKELDEDLIEKRSNKIRATLL